MMMSKYKIFSLIGFVWFLGTSIVSGQSNKSIAENYLKYNTANLKINKKDIQQKLLSSAHTNRKTGAEYIYYQQAREGIPVHEAVLNMTIHKNKVISSYSRFIPKIDSKLEGNVVLSAFQATHQALENLSIENSRLEISSQLNDARQTIIFSKTGRIENDIETSLIFYPTEDGKVKIGWSLQIDLLNPEYQMWHVIIDAQSGEELYKRDLVLRCNFGHKHTGNCNHRSHSNDRTRSLVGGGEYRVYPLGIESPNHGDRELVIDPADINASPFGWHDTDGVSGAEFTITDGNNVTAQEDINGNNGTGFSPDGGESLLFDYEIDFNSDPETDSVGAMNRSASLTNLFYWNNILHDVMYQYGFDEASGNFQENNYGNGGIASDGVLADGLDGSGLNNANFGTPLDGGNPRMQMFLWSGQADNSFEVNSPGSIAGNYNSSVASFGPDNFDITGELVLASDGTVDSTLACNPLTNGNEISGNIALIDRGSCQFGTKVLNAENEGAIAVIVCNNVSGGTFSMGPGVDGGSVTIPSIMISQSDCATIRAELPGINITMSSTAAIPIDGSFDNGIISHEYGHGINHRLTGGANVECLGNQERGDEGWSDFFGLVLTHRPMDIDSTPRGIGTYAQNQDTDGPGIRPFPYTVDMSVNPSTYDDIKTFSVPHGVGSVWCTMLWDLYWAFIDIYGYDDDLYYGTGGNNKVIQLVIDGLKMQPCSPGFVDARDAILAADRINFNGAHQCLIWEVFARRGLGYSATQGSGGDRSDGTEAFDVPNGVDIVNVSIDTAFTDGDTVLINANAVCQCTNRSEVTFINKVSPDLTITNAQVGTIINDTISNYIDTLNIGDTISLVYTVKLNDCIPDVFEDLYFDDIEGEDKWTSSVLDNTGMWEKNTSQSNSPDNSWYALNYNISSDYALTMDTSIMVNEYTEFSFFHKFDTEPSWDGGVVELSTNNGLSWEDMGPYFIKNSYPSTFSGSNLSGRQGFTGSSEAFFGTTEFLESVADLSSLNGETIKIRFRFASDSNTDGSGINGWHIDDISVKNQRRIEIEEHVIIEDVLDSSSAFDIEVEEIERIYVSENITMGLQNGKDWDNAYSDVQMALTTATCNQKIKEIWISEGEYFPTEGIDRNAHFALIPNVSIYGGFQGNELVLEDRNINLHQTILSGNIGDEAMVEDNSYNVFLNGDSTIDSTAVLDGVIISNGYNNNAASDESGAGMLNIEASPTIMNCTFMNHFSMNKGGALANTLTSSPLITNTIFSGNQAANGGGALFNSGSKQVNVTDCTFLNNTSVTGTATTILNENKILNLENILIIDPNMGSPNTSIRNEGAGVINTKGNVTIREQ